jgi:hypothetical protein
VDNIRGSHGMDKFQPTYFQPKPKVNITDPFKPGFMKDFDPFGRDKIDLTPYDPPMMKYGIRPDPVDIRQMYGIIFRPGEENPPPVMRYGIIRPDPDIRQFYGIIIRPGEEDPPFIKYGIRSEPLPPRAVALYGYPMNPGYK